MPTSKPYLIEKPEQIKLLASVVRQDILDSVAALGQCSISELSLELGMAADTLYYHVKKLVKSGLLIENGSRQTNRREEMVYTVPNGALRLNYKPNDPNNKKLVTDTVASMLRGAERDFKTGFKPNLAVTEGNERNLWGGRIKMWLSPEELQVVNQLLAQIEAIGSRPRQPDSRQLCTFTWVLSPVEAQPKRREK